jgi:hypothetical protein
MYPIAIDWLLREEALGALSEQLLRLVKVSALATHRLAVPQPHPLRHDRVCRDVNGGGVNQELHRPLLNHPQELRPAVTPPCDRAPSRLRSPQFLYAPDLEPPEALFVWLEEEAAHSRMELVRPARRERPEAVYQYWSLKSAGFQMQPGYL